MAEKDRSSREQERRLEAQPEMDEKQQSPSSPAPVQQAQTPETKGGLHPSVYIAYVMSSAIFRCLSMSADQMGIVLYQAVDYSQLKCDSVQ